MLDPDHFTSINDRFGHMAWRISALPCRRPGPASAIPRVSRQSTSGRPGERNRGKATAAGWPPNDLRRRQGSRAVWAPVAAYPAIASRQSARQA
jgi:hypothetical protein